jgi:hypothetical protein
MPKESTDTVKATRSSEVLGTSSNFLNVGKRRLLANHSAHCETLFLPDKYHLVPVRLSQFNETLYQKEPLTLKEIAQIHGCVLIAAMKIECWERFKTSNLYFHGSLMHLPFDLLWLSSQKIAPLEVSEEFGELQLRLFKHYYSCQR